jgi:peptidoglycan/LPS O-acetylase OafA/YrhL
LRSILLRAIVPKSVGFHLLPIALPTQMFPKSRQPMPIDIDLNRQTFSNQSRFGSLDGLRALSILAVIWHHTVPATTTGYLAHFGAHGVTLFFAISGFLITTLLLREKDKHGRIDLSAFYVRRSLRILPLYFGVLLVYVAMVWAFERHSLAGQVFFRNLIYFATYTSNLFVPLDGRTIFFFAWSLATEEQYYLLWPPALVLLGSLRRANLPLFALAASCVAAECMGSTMLSSVPIAMIVGTLLALVLHTPKGHSVAYRCLGHAASPLAMIALLGLAIGWEPTSGFVADLLCVGLVGSCVIREDHLLSRCLAWRPLSCIGMISYGMYMLHMLCKSLSIKLLGAAKLPHEGFLVFGLTVAIAMVAATVSFYTFEAFFMRLKHKWGKARMNPSERMLGSHKDFRSSPFHAARTTAGS